MFYRYGYRIINLRHVRQIYIRDSIYRKPILGFEYITPSGNFLFFNNDIHEITFKDEHSMMKEYNKICKMIEDGDKINLESHTY
jgi:hypothetical protein